MKKWVALPLVVLLVCAAGFGLAQWGYERAQLSFERAPVRITLTAGDGLRTAGRQLREVGVAVPDWALALVGRLRDDVSRIHQGTYELSPPLSLRTLVDRLVAGDVLHSEVLLIEGWTFGQMRTALAANPDLARDGAALEEKALLAAIGAEHDRAEGLFFPNTYRFAVGTSELEIYRIAYRKMMQVLEAAWADRDATVPLASPYEALVLASIVEKETGVEADRPLVAGVFANRLRKGMMLQSDPTTIYGLGDRFDGDLRRRDLRADTPWNTYTRKGLPPTPIALPGAASIAAVMKPAQTTALYFVARGDGSSHFSDTLGEHQEAVRKYQLKR